MKKKIYRVKQSPTGNFFIQEKGWFFWTTLETFVITPPGTAFFYPKYYPDRKTAEQKMEELYKECCK